MKSLLVIVLSLFFIYASGQTASPKSNNTIVSDIEASASDSLWCTSGQISLGEPVFGKDTITYDFMANVKELVLNISPKLRQGGYYVKSFKLQVNDENPVTISGPKYDFSKLTQLKRGGMLKITDCQVGCHGIVTLPDKLIIVKKGVN